jgi:hypothetical protein
VVLLVWLALVNLTYQKGVVETTETMTIAALFIVLCVLLIRKWDQHWLPIYLLFSGFAMVLWTAFWHGDAYLYKAVKNGIYIGELGAVGVSVWTTRKRSAT